jgi:thiol-disulfide isomerase/thioredoxin
MNTKNVALFAVAAVVAGGLGFWVNSTRLSVEPDATSPATAPAAVSTTANAMSPEWKLLVEANLKDLSGQPADWRPMTGKVTVVNFWATWCGPCKEEIPDLVRLQTEGQAKNVQIVGIGIDTPANMKPFASNMKINYPLMDASVGGIDLSKTLGNRVGALPFTIILNTDGSVITRRLGKISYEDLKLATGL